jgi:hypothetical protein
MWSLQLQNRHHHRIYIKKLLQNIYNTYVFASITINGHSNHKTDIIIEFTSKNCSRTYITLTYLLVLPYMVTPITKQSSPSNSYQKTTLKHTYITLMYLLILPCMVTPITKWTSPLNSHQKTAPNHIQHLHICWYCHISLITKQM